jgi:hypothetical protein
MDLKLVVVTRCIGSLVHLFICSLMPDEIPERWGCDGAFALSRKQYGYSTVPVIIDSFYGINEVLSLSSYPPSSRRYSIPTKCGRTDKDGNVVIVVQLVTQQQETSVQSSVRSHVFNNLNW